MFLLHLLRRVGCPVGREVVKPAIRELTRQLSREGGRARAP